MKELTFNEINTISGGITNRAVIWEYEIMGKRLGGALGVACGLLSALETGFTLDGALITAGISMILFGYLGANIGSSLGKDIVIEKILDQQFI